MHPHPPGRAGGSLASEGSHPPPRRGNTYKTTIVNSQLQLGDEDPSLERLFSTHIKVVPFSHRALYSIRHPFVQHTILDQGAQGGRGGRGGHLRSTQPLDTLQKLRLKSPIHAQQEERKWVELAHLIDTIVGEDEVAERRADVLASTPFQIQVELLWYDVVPRGEEFMGKAAYIDVTCAAWRHYVGRHVESGSEFFKLMMRGAEHDWSVDVQACGAGGGGAGDRIPYGQFCIAMLELVDTWVPTSKAEHYAAALEQLRPLVAKGRPAQPAAQRVSSEDNVSGPSAEAPPSLPGSDGSASAPPPPPPPGSWAAKKEMIARNYQAGVYDFLGSKTIEIRRRPVTGLGEYQLVDPQEGLPPSAQ